MKAYKHIPTSTHDSKIVNALPTQMPKGVKGNFDPHQIVRKAYLAGYPMPVLKAGPLKPEKNVLYNKAEIKRPAFLNVKILPRQVPDFDKLEELDIKQFGRKVQLTKINDKISDKYFEKDDKIKEKLNKIEEAIRNGLQENKENRVALIGELTKILAKSGSVELIEANRKIIQDIMNKLDVPLSRQAYDLPKYIDYNNYMRQEGVINLYLINKAYEKKDGDPVRPVLSHSQTQSKYIELNSIKSSLNNGNILDIENSAMFTDGQIKRLFNDLQSRDYAFSEKTLNYMRQNNRKPKTPKRIR